MQMIAFITSDYLLLSKFYYERFQLYILFLQRFREYMEIVKMKIKNPPHMRRVF